MTFKRELELLVDSNGEINQINFLFNKIINGGFTGRDQVAVQAHIQELAEEGIPGPEVTPVFFSLTCNTLVCKDLIQVNGPKTSGEVEYVMCLKGDKTYIGIGSDHSDRALEQSSMGKAKEICPNIISETVWDYDDIKDHWNELEISSVVKNKMGDEYTLYQKDTLASIMHPDELKSVIMEKLKNPDLDKTIIYSGTIPVVANSPIYGELFGCKLYDPILDKTLRCEYEIQSVHSIF